MSDIFEEGWRRMVVSDMFEEGWRRMVEEIIEEKERQSLLALYGTDWSETPIVDLIWVHARQPLWEPGEPVKIGYYRVRRYSGEAPKYSDVDVVEGHRCEVQRVTRPLWEKLQEEHDIPTVSEVIGDG